MRCEELNKLGLELREDWNVSDLILASGAGYLEGSLMNSWTESVS